MTLGCVAGKFYPPHAGHLFVVDTALASCAELHLLVIERPDERPTGKQRAAWLCELYPQVKVHLTPDDIPDEHEAWAARTRTLLGRAPDSVFTSEAYGPGWADALGCEHVSVDDTRASVPVSGTAVRSDPITHWSHLPEPTRGYFARRVVLVGAESTGKTTLARQLSARLNAPWVPEWARLYGEARSYGASEWEEDDSLFRQIALNQPIVEDIVARRSDGLVVCDTDLLLTLVWAEAMHRGAEDLEIVTTALERAEAAAPSRRYLLLVDDLPWVQDGMRFAGPGARTRDRSWFTERLRAGLAERGHDFAEVSGHGPARLETAFDAVANLSWR